jgi:ABC-type lipoprotein release transport system permease subunit
MKEYLKIAWRNLWRNRKRTLITMASVFFAVFLAVMMRSMQLGTYDVMEDNTIRNSTGHIQVHQQGYWDDKSINNTFSGGDSLSLKIARAENVELAVPRLESFALASSGILSKGVVVIGTDPATENEAGKLEKRLVEGRYLEKDDEGVLIVINLAKYLDLEIGDTITLISQGYHGVTAAGIYPVRGILDFPSTSMNNKLLYMDLRKAQHLYGAPDMLTSISVMLDDPDRLESTMAVIREKAGDGYEIMDWREMNTELVQAIESDNISGMFMLGILYVIVGFGIFGTMMMMTLERRREFGVMVSVGMRRYRLGLIILLETVFIALAGVVAGSVMASPLMYYFNLYPIELTGEAAKAMLDFNADPVLPFALDFSIYYNQALVVLALTFLALIYPLISIQRLDIIKAIKGK